MGPRRSFFAVAAAMYAVCGCARHAAPAPPGSDGGSGAPNGPGETVVDAPDSALLGDGRADDPRFPSRVAAIAWEVKIREQPNLQGAMLGYLRAGAVVRASAAPISKEGCSGGWVAIAPAGFVCVEANVATTDVGHPIVQALSCRPDLNARLPYMYGLVRQRSPIYSRLPNRTECVHNEYALAKHMEYWLRAKGEAGATFRADYWMHGKGESPPDSGELWESRTTTEVPAWLEGAPPPGNLSGRIIGRRLVIGKTLEHQGFAFVDTAVVEGRRYGITTDLLVVPVDRLRPIEGSTYHGVHIPQDIDVPFALIRRDGAWQYELRGEAMVRREAAPRRAAFKLTGKELLVGTRRYFETPDGKWLSESHASRIDRFKRLTKWAQDKERWIDVSIANQTLVAYEGTAPVYATLVSTGEAGLDNPETTKSTIVGEFRVFAKHVTTTMSSAVVGEEFELKDIPFVQYFQDGYALHAAYWHDDFGIPRSHGCINLSPEDARWLFSWTEPQVPQGWHGARSTNHGSVVLVHP